MPDLAGWDVDTTMPRIPPNKWWHYNLKFQAHPDEYQTLYVTFLFDGWEFADFMGDGPPSDGKLTAWGEWTGENPTPGKNWWTTFYDEGNWLPVADGTDWVNKFWEIQSGLANNRNGDWDDWADIIVMFPVIASEKNKFILGMASRIVGKMAQLRAAQMFQLVLGLANRGRPITH